MKYAPYSVSKIGTFEQCPKKFKYQYIDKVKVDKNWYYLEKGKLCHSLLEAKLEDRVQEWQKPDTPFINQHTYRLILQNLLTFCNSSLFKDIYTRFQKFEGYVEHRFGYNTKFQTIVPKNMWSREGDPVLRGAIDLVLLDREKNVCYLYDWKTGGKDVGTIQRFPKDTFQLEIYSAWVQDHFGIDTVYAGYVFIEHSYMQDPVVIRDSKGPKKKFLEKIKTIENTQDFSKNPGPLCDYCDFLEYCNQDS